MKHRKCPSTARICHCLLPVSGGFYVCCGYWCRTCKGRIDGRMMPEVIYRRKR